MIDQTSTVLPEFQGGQPAFPGAGGSLPSSDLATKFATELQELADIIIGGKCVPAPFREVKERLLDIVRDKARLDWLIKQGPPGAAEGQGLNEETWDVGCTMVDDDVRTDAVAVRKGIDAAMSEANVAGEPRGENH